MNEVARTYRVRWHGKTFQPVRTSTVRSYHPMNLHGDLSDITGRRNQALSIVEAYEITPRWEAHPDCPAWAEHHGAHWVPGDGGDVDSMRCPGTPAQLGVADVAALTGIARSTISSYRSRGRMPTADGSTPEGPWWYVDTIRAWAQSRPGQGARTDLTE